MEQLYDEDELSYLPDYALHLHDVFPIIYFLLQPFNNQSQNPSIMPVAIKRPAAALAASLLHPPASCKRKQKNSRWGQIWQSYWGPLQSVLMLQPWRKDHAFAQAHLCCPLQPLTLGHERAAGLLSSPLFGRSQMVSAATSPLCSKSQHPAAWRVLSAYPAKSRGKCHQVPRSCMAPRMHTS